MTKRLTEDDFEELLELKRHMDNADPRTNWVGRMAGYQEAAGKMAPLLIEELRELRAFKAQVGRVKACDFCCGYGALPSVGDGVPINRGCDECGGLP